MSGEIPFHLADEMKSAIDVTDNCLIQMKKCCELEIPFHVVSEMESAIDVTQDCLKQMKKCCELARKLESLRSYEREGSVTKVMLILTLYGSKDKFRYVIANAITTFADGLEKLRNYVEGIEAMVEEKKYKCPRCQGAGALFKWVYVRERGTPAQQIYRSFRCDYCGEKGHISIDIAVQISLNAFLEKTKELSAAMRKFHNSLQDFTSTSYTRVEPVKEPRITARTRAREDLLAIAPKREEIATEIYEKPKPRKPPWPYPKEYFLKFLNLERATSYYYRSPDGTPTWWERRANKQYLCSDCRKLIAKGDRYIGCRKLRPGMRGPYGYRGTYITEYYHIVCLLKEAQAEVEGNIENSNSEISRLREEIASFRDEAASRRQQIENCETLRQTTRKDYEDTSIWRKLDKWVSYRYTSWSKGREVSRLEKEIAEIEDREIPRRETGIVDLNERISSLQARLGKIQKRIKELARSN